MTNEQKFEEYLVSIGGLVNGYYPDRPAIVNNICECGEGWLPLIQDLIEKLIDAGWNKEICQIKQKFGALRFYINDGSEKMFEIIAAYERISLCTCETCGEEGQLRRSPSGWMHVKCDIHARPQDSTMNQTDKSKFFKI
jgi:hypothetical protein